MFVSCQKQESLANTKVSTQHLYIHPGDRQMDGRTDGQTDGQQHVAHHSIHAVACQKDCTGVCL